ncbi:efflux RND transporter periplasmic adaptor subunit [Pedobacter sp. GR22-10]|uniref:efflux RND transporter periplasmic adaptor subunit n=1 Tax=Pedobacter TaxID=84567 RepID=UPI002247A3F1|nr:efflux RND transporter periplasmic adaptor subunit [Pedobacter sp. GR22-10]MCX2429645.1 efflux RND transporter periplasmic adaptor subunit [Pedobacter sp. GR22-10]
MQTTAKNTMFRNNLFQLALAIVTTVTFAACGGKKTEKSQEETPVPVEVKTISNVAETKKLSYSGTIDPDNTAQIGFAVPGVVSSISVQEGQHVNKGQLLATIDATEYTNSVAIANAALEQAQDMFNRLEGLYKKGSLPEKDFIEIKTKLAQAKASKNINSKRVSDSRLYAPISGIVSSKSVERGSTAAPGIVAFTIIKTDQVYARISVPESEVGEMKKSLKVTVEVPTLHKSFNGVISIVNPQADAVSKTFIVKIRLDNPSGILLPGMITNVNVNTGEKIDATIIPTSAIVRDADGITYVFIASEHKKAVKRRVTTGNLSGSNEVTITDGLTPGDNLIVAGQSNLKEGITVSF